MAYEVRTDVFEGPFDLLLQLITAQRVDLYEIALADIVDAYLAELDRREHLDLEVATEFLLIAATLVELKCRRLLPGPDDVELDEELALFEARDLLLARLVECRTFTAAAEALASLAVRAERSVPRRAGPDERFSDVVVNLLEGVTTLDFAAAARRALEPRPVPRVEVDHVLVDEVGVAETTERLATVLASTGRVSFRELSASCGRRIEVVVTFLALLELYKRGLVDLDQAQNFGDLVVIWHGPSGPDAAWSFEAEETVEMGYRG